MEHQDADENEELGNSSCRETADKTLSRIVDSSEMLKPREIGNMETGESSDWDEIVEENFIHVVLDSFEDSSTINANSNVLVTALETESPVLQIENKVSVALNLYIFFVFKSNLLYNYHYETCT